MSSHLSEKQESSVQDLDFVCNSIGSMTLMEGEGHNTFSITRTRNIGSGENMAVCMGAGALFCKYTSAHGFKCSVSPERSPLNRLLWKLGIVTALFSLTWGLYGLMGNYFKYTIKTVLDIKYVSELPFPSVTLCSLNAHDYRKADSLPNVTNGGEKLHNILMAENIASEKSVEDYLFHSNYTDILQQSFSHIYTTLGGNISDLIKYCAWNGAKTACESMFRTVHTMDGLCYQFNYKPSSPVNATLVGPSSGLAVVLIQARQHNVGPTISGLKVLLHHPGSFPDMINQGFLVPLGFTTVGRLHIRQCHHLPYPYKSYGENYCLTKEEITEDRDYSRDSCIAACADRLAEEACNCSVDSQDMTRPMKPDCTLRQALVCIRPRFAKALLDASSNRECTYCKYRCDASIFSMTTSQATFPLNGDQLSNYMEFRLFYDQLIKEEIHYAPEYTWYSMLGIIGGYMGLFIGASVLTICEAIEFLGFSIQKLFQKFRGRLKFTPCERNSDEDMYNI